jgi:5-methylthioadenosine/S-adenosylhomocysteine deaminase
LETGLLEEGKLADIALIDMEHYLMTPSHSAISNLVYSANGNVVKHLICDGRILMKNREVAGEKEILVEAARCAQQLYY